MSRSFGHDERYIPQSYIKAADRWATVSLLWKDMKIQFISEAVSTPPNCETYLTAYVVE